MSNPRAVLLDHAKLQLSLQELAASAQNLNILSDQLNKQVAAVESVLNNMGIGITAYVDTESWSDERRESYDIWRLKYEKNAGKWGFTVSHLWGLEADPEGESETWQFKDAPREHRIKAVGKIPDLIEALVKRSKEVASDISAGMSYVQELAAAFAKRPPESAKK